MEASSAQTFFTPETIQLLWSVGIGVGTGLSSSLAFLWFLTKIRPKIQISEEIAFDEIEVDGKISSCYRFKIINKTWKSKIYDIEAQLILLTFVNSDGGQNVKLDPIPLLKDRVWSLRKANDDDDKNAEFAYHFITTENLHEMWDKEKNIELRIKAKHSFSGFTKTVSKRYFKQHTAVKKGSFKFGEDMGIS